VLEEQWPGHSSGKSASNCSVGRNVIYRYFSEHNALADCRVARLRQRQVFLKKQLPPWVLSKPTGGKQRVPRLIEKLVVQDGLIGCGTAGHL
jgi:hypothetical protein